jgi:hypothetical protein
MVWPFRKILILGLAMLMPAIEGCSYIGPNSLNVERRRYNDVIQKTNDEELLLNLVRMRYNDRPSFLNVNSITSSLSISAAAAASKSIATDGDAVSTIVRSLTPSFSVRDSPTISYSPLQGDVYVRDFLTPVTPKLMALLGTSGWPLSITLKLCVAQMNNILNAPSASRPSPHMAPDFEQFDELILNLNEMAHDVNLGYAVLDGKVQPSLRFSNGALKTPAGRNVARLLQLAPGINEFALSSNDWLGKKNVINIRTRSLMGVLYMLSHIVDVPVEHFEKGWVNKTITAGGKNFDWDLLLNGLFKVSVNSERPPETEVAVEYKDKWFSIAQDDINTKITLTMISQLLAMLSGSDTMKAPVLTIPVK